MKMGTLAEKINVSATRYADVMAANESALIDSSADVIMGTPTFFFAGVGIAQIIVATLD
jgi:hypothetical protein